MCVSLKSCGCVVVWLRLQIVVASRKEGQEEEKKGEYKGKEEKREKKEENREEVSAVAWNDCE